MKMMETEFITSQMVETNINMPPKYHYIKHCVDFCCLFSMPLGYVDEEGLEGIRVQYMMEKIYLITSPKYSQMYTNGKSNK